MFDFNPIEIGNPQPEAFPKLPDVSTIPTFRERMEKIGIKPAESYVLDSIAGKRKEQIVRATLTGAADSGKTTSEIADETDLQEAQRKLQELLNQFDSKSPEYSRLEQALTEEVRRQVEVPKQAGLQPPSMAQAIFAALGALAMPDYAFSIGAAPFQEQLRQQQIGTEQNQLQYEADLMARKENIGLMSDQLQRQGQMDNALLQTQIGLQKDNINRIEDQIQTRQDQVKNLRARFETANNPGEIKYFGRLLRQTDPSQAPTEEEERAAIRSLGEKPLKDYNAYILNAYKTFQINDADRAQLMLMRESLISEYNLDPSRVPEVPTSDTLTKLANEQKQKNWQANFDLRKDQFKLAQDKFKWGKEAHGDRMAARWAAIDISRQYLGIARDRKDIYGASFYLDQFRGTTDKEMQGIANEIQKLEAKKAALRSRAGKIVGNGSMAPTEDAIKANTELAAINDEISFWKSKYQELAEMRGAEGDVVPSVDDALAFSRGLNIQPGGMAGNQVYPDSPVPSPPVTLGGLNGPVNSGRATQGRGTPPAPKTKKKPQVYGPPAPPHLKPKGKGSDPLGIL